MHPPSVWRPTWPFKPRVMRTLCQLMSHNPFLSNKHKTVANSLRYVFPTFQCCIPPFTEDD